MAAQKGKDLLLKAGDGAGGFVTVAGLRARQIAFNAETVDVTHSESAGRWRELLAGAGVRRASISGSINQNIAPAAIKARLAIATVRRSRRHSGIAKTVNNSANAALRLWVKTTNRPNSPNATNQRACIPPF